MKIISNKKIIQRNKKIGQIATIASLVILGIGLFLSFKQIYINWSFAALLIGFILSQVGMNYGAKWGGTTTIDERFNLALKGLDQKYSLYHYSTVVPHLLVGPAGIWILAPFHQRGTITFDQKTGRWKQKGGNLYLKIFGQESLGRPEFEIQSLEKTFRKFLEKNLEQPEIVKFNTALVFTNEKTEIQTENPSHPTLSEKKLKDFIRQRAKEKPLDPLVLEKVLEILPKE